MGHGGQLPQDRDRVIGLPATTTATAAAHAIQVGSNNVQAGLSLWVALCRLTGGRTMCSRGCPEGWAHPSAPLVGLGSKLNSNLDSIYALLFAICPGSCMVSFQTHSCSWGPRLLVFACLSLVGGMLFGVVVLLFTIVVVNPAQPSMEGTHYNKLYRA